MTEKEINRKYIRERLEKIVPAYCVKNELVEDVRKMLSEAYKQGFSDGYFMRRTDEQLERENELIYEMEER